MRSNSHLTKQMLTPMVLLALTACNTTKYVPEGEHLLTKNIIKSDNKEVNAGALTSYIKQQPNTKWFSLAGVPLAVYNLSSPDTTKAFSRLMRKWGEEPVILNQGLTQMSAADLTRAMQNEGYLDAQTTVEQKVNGRKTEVDYHIATGKRYKVKEAKTNIADHMIDSIYKADLAETSPIRPGNTFSINTLHDERSRIASHLSNLGYVFFNKEAVTFAVDSSRTDHTANVMMNIGLFRRSSSEDLHEHPRYRLRHVAYHTPDSTPHRLRERTLDINTQLREGQMYREKDIEQTYRRFARLGAVRSTNIRLTPVADSIGGGVSTNEHLMDADISLTYNKPHSITLQPEGTNTAGDLGAALALTYENRNVFGGSESFSLQARGAYEAIKGLEGYQRNNFMEYNLEGRLSVPEFVMPGLSRGFQRRHNVKTDFSVSYNKQNRPEFHRRVFNAAWTYKWQAASKQITYQYDFLDVSYVSMPWISETFRRDYLDDTSNRNAILRYNYEDLLIMKTGFGINYSDANNSLKLNVESAGNLLAASARLFKFSKNEDDNYKFALVAFAQYVKMDVDYAYHHRIDERNTLVLHSRLGVAVPYGNSQMMPYEKRYFAGGANSVRGWSVRELGPGRFAGTDGRIDFINQTGDFKLDLNAELRSGLFWKLQGAVFVDAGNVWTLRRYEEQEGGQLTLRSLWRDMAAAYGVGLRLDFNYFVLRLDMGMKAVNPVYTTSKEHYPIFHPRFSRDYALHFAVGMPF